MQTARQIMLMHRRVAVGPDATGVEIVNRILSTGLPGLPVVNEKMEVVGIVTEFNVLGAIREGMKLDEITATKIMSTEPTTAEMDATAERLVEIMLENNFTVVPIVSNKELRGVVDRSSILDDYVATEALRPFQGEGEQQ
jgi:CBS domain-containing protein